VENFLDMSHFAFVHEGSLGDRGHAEVPQHDVQLDDAGRPGVASYRAWQPLSSAVAAGGAWIAYRYQVLSPYAAVLEKKPQGGALREVYALWVCPLSNDASRAWFTLHTSDAQRSDGELRAFQDAIFAQDRPIIESQQPKCLPLAGAEVHSAADRLSAAYRRYLTEQGITFGVCG
jgi:phenylpropionate dioxygenase-like ring-hydroxylating dioxygenase large terminal subunit